MTRVTIVVPLYRGRTWIRPCLCSVLDSREISPRVMVFDPAYFLYAEEEDLCRRARFHGGRGIVRTHRTQERVGTYTRYPSVDRTGDGCQGRRAFAGRCVK